MMMMSSRNFFLKYTVGVLVFLGTVCEQIFVLMPDTHFVPTRVDFGSVIRLLCVYFVLFGLISANIASFLKCVGVNNNCLLKRHILISFQFSSTWPTVVYLYFCPFLLQMLI